MEITRVNNNKFIWYRIQKHDNLTTIIERFNTSPNMIVRNNPTVDYYEGEMIKILINPQHTHIVKPMETLDDVANKYDVEVDTLMRLNNLNSKRLFIGQILNIHENKNS